MDIKILRSKYPQYKDLSDKQLADALHNKYYSDMPVEQFYAKIGLSQNNFNTFSQQSSDYSQSKTPVNKTISAVPQAKIAVNPIEKTIYPQQSQTENSIYFWVIAIVVIVIYFVSKKNSEDTAQNKKSDNNSDSNSRYDNDSQYDYGYKKQKEYTSSSNQYNYKRQDDDTSNNNNNYQYEKKQNEQSYHNKRSDSNQHNTFDDRLDELNSNLVKCYETLEVPQNATPSEIKAAFKKKMSSYHPDKVSGLGEKLRTVAEEESKLINVAYQTLKTNGKC